MCLACDTKLSAESLDEFGTRYLDILNHGALAVMISMFFSVPYSAAEATKRVTSVARDQVIGNFEP